LIDDIFGVIGKVASVSIYENCITGNLLRGRTLVVVSEKPDLFWARDTAMLVILDQGKVTTQTEAMVDYIKAQRIHPPVAKKNDTIDPLFESMATLPSEDDYFDEASLMRDSIRFDDEDDVSREEFKTRDYAYSTYFAACGGWRYWMAAILFTLLARLASISESYWLKEGKPYFIQSIIYFFKATHKSNTFSSCPLGMVCRIFHRSTTTFHERPALRCHLPWSLSCHGSM
jgi:hypothetical protein